MSAAARHAEYVDEGLQYGNRHDAVIRARFHGKYTITDGGCWLWTNYIDPRGYGRFHAVGQRTCLAHRWAYLAFVGPIPADRPMLDHLCRNRSCVNPEHLEPVDNRENQRRGENPWAGVAYRTNTCTRGHSLDDAYMQTGRNGNRVRVCRECQRRRYAEYRARKAVTR